MDLIEKMLVYDPEQRILASDALRHEWFEEFHDSDDEPDAQQCFNWKYVSKERTVEEWKETIYREVEEFKNG